MTNNDILRHLRSAFDLKEHQVGEIIGHTDAGKKVHPSQVAGWLERDSTPGFIVLSDLMLGCFLDGLIIEKRGLRSDGLIPDPLEVLPSNEILRKLRIALDLRDADMHAVFERADFVVTKSELGSFFRNSAHRNYRPCPPEVLQAFLNGLGR